NDENQNEVTALQRSQAQEVALHDREHESSLKRAAAEESAGVGAKLEQLRTQIERQYRAQLDELAARDHQAYDQAARDHQTAPEEQAARLEGEKQRALDALRSEWEARLADARREHEDVLALRSEMAP